MPWVVDTCVLLDIAEHDPHFGQWSSETVDRCRNCGGCVVSPVSAIELAPRFAGNFKYLRQFLAGCGIGFSEPWLESDTEAAFKAWNQYVQLKRGAGTVKKPIADILIGAFAAQRLGLITRNPSDFTPWFPNLQIVQP